MTERRIGYSTDKAELLRRLTSSEDGAAPFRLLVDALAFAAALGFRKDRRVPLAESQGEPIRQEVFDRQGYDTLMNLLAMHAADSADALADMREKIEERATVFEQYANGGLEILQEELRGAVDPLEHLILLINSERQPIASDLQGFDLTKLA